jgi:predicted RND superfamily exporter protein
MSSTDFRTESEHSNTHRVSRVGSLAGVQARWSATHPRLVLIGAVVVLVLSLISVSRLHISTSLAVMLGTQSSTAAAFERVTSAYKAADAMLLLVDLPPGRVADEAGHAELVEFATRLESALKSDPQASRLVSWVRFREDPAFLRFAQNVMLPNGAYYLSDASAAELLRRLDLGPMQEQLARNQDMMSAPGPAGVALSKGVLRDPLRLFELIPPELTAGRTGTMAAADSGTPAAGNPEFSEDQRALLVHIGASSVGSDYEAASLLADAVARCAAAANTTGLRVVPAGSAAIARESSRVIRRDSIVSCLVSVGLLYFLFFMFYRRWTAALMIGGVAAVGMLAGIGVLALFIHEVSPMAATIGALLAGLGTDYGIHFLSHYDGYRDQGLGTAEASVQTVQHMAVPIATNCFTSIFGFISLWPSKIQMLSDFAVMGASGLIGALIAVFMIMPAALAVIDRGSGPKSAERASFGRLADFVAVRARGCMASTLAVLGIVLIAAAAQGFSLEFESDLTVIRPRPSPAFDATNEIIRRFSGQGEMIAVEVNVPTPQALVEAAHDAAAAFGSPSCRAMGVTGVIGLHTLLPDPRHTELRTALLRSLDPDRVVASFDAALQASDFAPAAYAGYRDFLRTLVSSRHAPTVRDVLDNPAVAEQVFPEATITSGAQPTSTVLLVRLAAPLNDRLQRRIAVDALDSAAASVHGGVVTVAGMAAVAAELEEASRDGMVQSVILSFGLVLLWLLIVFRRPLDVLLALMPLVFAAGTTILFIIATAQKFNPINSVAIPLLDGIAVDAGVFLVSVYRAHGTTRAELRLHLHSTTHAVLLSVGTTVTAFTSLLFTHTPAVRSMGLVSAVGIVASGLGALLLLMPLLIRRAPEMSTPHRGRAIAPDNSEWSEPNASTSRSSIASGSRDGSIGSP